MLQQLKFFIKFVHRPTFYFTFASGPIRFAHTNKLVFPIRAFSIVQAGVRVAFVDVYVECIRQFVVKFQQSQIKFYFVSNRSYTRANNRPPINVAATNSFSSYNSAKFLFYLNPRFSRSQP